MSAALNQSKVDGSTIAVAAAESAVTNGDVKAEATRKLESSQPNGMTPLMHAVCDDSVDVVQTLLDCGADVNAKRNDGFTALALAAFFGRTRIVQLLLEKGADVRAVTRFGTSPEMWAKARGFREIVDLLRGVSEIAIALDEDSAIPERDVTVIPDDELVLEPAEEKRPFAARPLMIPRILPEIHDPPPVIGSAFHPGHAFIARLSSDRRSLAALTVALIFALGLGIFATYQVTSLFRDDARQTAATDTNLPVQPQAEPQTEPQTEIAQPGEMQSAPQASAPQQAGSNQAVTVDVPNEVAPGPSQESTTAATMVKPGIKILPTSRAFHSPVSTLKRDTVIRREQPKVAEPESDLKPAPLTVEVTREHPNPAPATRAADPPPVPPAPLGITSSKPRTKVIQWP